jgi:hypothetical protein
LAANDKTPPESPLFSIYPNPVVDHLFLKTNKDIKGTIGVEILDVAGKQILRKEISALQKNIPIQIKLNHLSTGIYFIHLTTRMGSDTQKFEVF